MTWGFVLLHHLFDFPKTIYQTTSPISGKIRVVQKGRERKLLVNGVCQSINFDAPGIEERVWGRISEAAGQHNIVAAGHAPPLGKGDACVAATGELAITCANLSCLILGLGAGTIAHLLARQLPGIGIDGVELDPAIIEVGKKFFDLDKIPNLNIICTDAFDLVGNCGRDPDLSSRHSESPRNLGGAKNLRGFFGLRPQNDVCGLVESGKAFPNYDIIVADLYCGGRFPEKFECDEFLLGVKNLLEPQGIAIFNRIFRCGRKGELDSFTEKVEQIFGKVVLAEVSGPGRFANLLIVAGC